MVKITVPLKRGDRIVVREADGRSRAATYIGPIYMNDKHVVQFEGAGSNVTIVGGSAEIEAAQ